MHDAIMPRLPTIQTYDTGYFLTYNNDQKHFFH